MKLNNHHQETDTSTSHSSSENMPQSPASPLDNFSQSNPADPFGNSSINPSSDDTAPDETSPQLIPDANLSNPQIGFDASVYSPQIKNNQQRNIIIACIASVLLMIAGVVGFMQFNKIRELTAMQTELNHLQVEKSSLNLLSDLMDDYEAQLEAWQNAIDNKTLTQARTLQAIVSSDRNRLIQANQDYVDEQLGIYRALDLSEADVTEATNIKENVSKLQQLSEQKNYSAVKAVVNNLEQLSQLYITPANTLNVAVEQIDAFNYPSVKLYVRLQDSATGQTPSGLKQGLFYIRKKNANADYIRQAITAVGQLNQLEVLNTNIVADVSGSMAGSPILEAKNVMSNFINSVQFHAGDMVELISFSDGVYIEQEFTNNATLLQNNIYNLDVGDMTSLYDALYASVVRVASQRGAKCVIAFTDGLDNYSVNTAQDVINISQRYKVPIFIIGIGDVDVNMMDYIARQTGGRYYGINQISSMQNIYNEIYRMEKDLYLIEFTDSTGGGVFSESEILLGYNSAEYGGRTNYLYTPHTLVNVREQGLYANGPGAVVEGYIKGWDSAITYSDFSYISDYLKIGSPIYETQRKYIMQNISEQLDSYEIVNINYQSATRCIVTTNETFFVQLPNKPLKLLTQQCQYIVTQENGRWYMIDFVGSPTILSKIYY